MQYILVLVISIRKISYVLIKRNISLVNAIFLVYSVKIFPSRTQKIPSHFL